MHKLLIYYINNYICFGNDSKAKFKQNIQLNKKREIQTFDKKDSISNDIFDFKVDFQPKNRRRCTRMRNDFRKKKLDRRANAIKRKIKIIFVALVNMF